MLTMLNMLVAIMGDSFDYATENREKFALQTKMEILRALSPSLAQETAKNETKVFLIVAQPAEEDECA